ncbi:Exoenzymes regulatory protein AepA in lipid-linked oligosaccharide synthesis cluster [Leucobacter sp. 7(1)]|uniref:amidohydrolase n=1 Tax=Leucobacter sp. 7(1) TaxID=1255613 RepID=UPI00097EDFED|nr:amidohydrolase [Leucobacter sp. 7(1)]SJN09381.1 Exoenzymes regulatory protein AepA in lipid-linked oligosaccharide synthesis cluster [Leucobacter sp. 7(1)]
MSITVFTGGTILVDPTAADAARTSDAIAFRDGRVAALGDAAAALAGEPGTDVVDLAGGTLAPAPGDGHAHPMLGGVEALGPAVRQATDLQGILDAVAAWKAEHPEAEWIIGASYDATFAEGGLFDARWLDEVTGDTPTILRAWDYHTAWVNSAALAAGGITADTPDPHLGRIVRREDGSPLGTLQESAANNFLADVVPAFPLAQRLDAIERATRNYAELGMTWVQDAWVEPGDIEVYRTAAQTDRLHTRINLAFRADPVRWREQLAEFEAARASVRGLGADRLSGETVKFFLDGVVESHTAALLVPYADRPEDSGLPNWETVELNAATAAFDALGFQLHLHAIGDAANRSALNALEAATLTGPEHERHHVIAHVAVLDPADVDRFAKLGVIANFEPYWAQCDAVMRDLTIPHLGQPRDEWQYLIGSVHRSGATVSFGSDWPVTTIDWRPAVATAITRHDPTDPAATAWLPEERVDAATAYGAYTTGIARQALAADRRGTLAVGQDADAVWLADNPLAIAPEAITGLAVRGTWLAGERTFTA